MWRSGRNAVKLAQAVADLADAFWRRTTPIGALCRQFVSQMTGNRSPDSGDLSQGSPFSDRLALIGSHAATDCISRRRTDPQGLARIEVDPELGGAPDQGGSHAHRRFGDVCFRLLTRSPFRGSYVAAASGRPRRQARTRDGPRHQPAARPLRPRVGAGQLAAGPRGRLPLVGDARRRTTSPTRPTTAGSFDRRVRRYANHRALGETLAMLGGCGRGSARRVVRHVDELARPPGDPAVRQVPAGRHRQAHRQPRRQPGVRRDGRLRFAK